MEADWIRPLRAEDLGRVCAIHEAAFPGFFLTFLGPEFLAEFYGAFLREEEGVALVAVVQDGGPVIGVVAGPLVPQGFFGRLVRRRWWAFARAALGALCRRPQIAVRLFRALWYRGDAPQGPPRALLSSVAVDPRYQGKGVGAALVSRWVEEVRHRGKGGCYLTTDAVGNEVVNRFYARQGWRLETTYQTPEGRRMNRYVLDFVTGSEFPPENPRTGPARPAP